MKRNFSRIVFARSPSRNALIRDKHTDRAIGCLPPPLVLTVETKRRKIKGEKKEEEKTISPRDKSRIAKYTRAARGCLARVFTGSADKKQTKKKQKKPKQKTVRDVLKTFLEIDPRTKGRVRVCVRACGIRDRCATARSHRHPL